MKQNDGQRIPVWIWIDPTRKCNIACSLCYTKQSHKNQDLSRSTLREVLRRITASSLIDPQELTFNWRGEPLMNRRLHELLEEVSASGLKCPVQFHTNAMLMTAQRAAELVAVGQGLTIFVSIDGGSERSHDRNRGRGSYRLALAGAANLLEARGAHRWPRVVLYQLDLKELNTDFDPDFLALSEQVDAWLVTTPVLPDGDGKPFLHLGARRGGAKIVDEWMELPREYPVPQGPCFFAGNSLVISPEGKASICILSNNEGGVIGDTISEPIDEIILRARTWRDALSAVGRSGVSHCATCRKCEGVGRPRPYASVPLA